MAERVSAIIPFYKEIELISRAVESVLSQAVPDDVRVEVVIGNDSRFSESQIRAALPAAANALTTIARNDRAPGAGNARNVALSAASGDVIAFLDADDYWLPGKLTRQLALIRRGANFIPCAYRFEGRDFRIIPPIAVGSTVEMLSGTVGTSTIMVASGLLGSERFENLQFSQDLDLWARLAANPSFRYAAVPEEMVVYCPSTRTARKLRQFFRFRSVVRRFNLHPATRMVIYFRFAFRGVRNHYVRRVLARRI